MNFSDKLVKLRKENKMSQEDLAASLDVSRQSVSKWESGQTYPEMDKLLAICKIFNVTLDSLTNDEVDINNTENKDKNVIDSFFSFVKNTYNFIVNNTLLDNTKCFLVMMFTFLALLILKLPVNLLSNKVTNLITSVSQNDFTIFVANFFEFIFDFAYVALFIIVMIYIFKIGFLDKMDLKKDNDLKFTKEVKESKPIKEIKRNDYSFINLFSNILIVFVKFFIACFTFPFLVTLIIFFIGLIIILYFAFNGLTYIGLILISLSIIFLNILTIEFLFDLLFSKKVPFKRMLITLIASLSIFGIGSGLFSIEISKISYINSISPKFKTTKSEFNVKMQDNLLIDTNTHYEYVIDNTLDNIKIEVETYPDFVASHTEYQNYIYRIVLNDYEVNVKKIFDDFLQNLKHNKIYNYDFEDNSIIKIYANEKNINILKNNIEKEYKNIKNQTDIIDDINDKYDEIIDKYNELLDNYNTLKEENNSLKEENQKLNDKINIITKTVE